jgi:hypothetical protein
MGAHVFSPSLLAFYAVELRAAYDLSGSWPGDAVDVTDQVWMQYIGTPPDGMVLGADGLGQPTWVPLPEPPAPTQAQLAAIMLARGIEITSNSNPTLDGTYPCDAQSNSDDGNLLAAITAGLSLPNGVAVRIDTAGRPHAFLPAAFKDYCQAKLTFQQQLNTIIGSGSGVLPAQPTVIP